MRSSLIALLICAGMPWADPTHAGEPNWSAGTRILNQTGALRMLEGSLRLTIVIEAEFVDGAVGDGPGMSEVPLLEALGHDAAKPWDIGASQLEKRERLHCAVIIEIVIDAQVLLIGEPVVDFDGELIPSDGFGGNRGDRAVGACGRNELEQVDCCRIHASKGNLTVGKDRRKRVSRDDGPVRRTILNNSATNCGCGRLAPRTTRKNCRVVQRPCKW